MVTNQHWLDVQPKKKPAILFVSQLNGVLTVPRVKLWCKMQDCVLTMVYLLCVRHGIYYARPSRRIRNFNRAPTLTVSQKKLQMCI